MHQRLLLAIGSPLVMSFLTSGAIQALGVFTGVLLARELGPSQRGELAAVILWPTVLAAIASLGIAEAGTFYAARGEHSRASLAGTVIVIAAAQSAVAASLGLGVIPLALGSHASSTVQTALIYLSFIPLNLTGLFVSGIINGLGHAAVYQFFRLSVIFLQAAGLALLAALRELTVLNAAINYLLGNAIPVSLALVLLAHEAGYRLSFDKALAKKLLTLVCAAIGATSLVS